MTEELRARLHQIVDRACDLQRMSDRYRAEAHAEIEAAYRSNPFGAIGAAAAISSLSTRIGEVDGNEPAQ